MARQRMDTGRLLLKIKKEIYGENHGNKSILIKDTTREERIRIVQEGLNQCGEPAISAMAVTI